MNGTGRLGAVQMPIRKLPSAKARHQNDDADLCIVCSKRPTTHMVLPCSCRCLCEACIVDVADSCPRCGAAQQDICKVFSLWSSGQPQQASMVAPLGVEVGSWLRLAAASA